MLTTQLDRLIWRRHRKLFATMAVLAVLICVSMTFATISGLRYVDTTQIVDVSIRRWQVYSDDQFVAYSTFFHFMFLGIGAAFMNQDLKDNFNQFLFSSGFSRKQVYWAKLRIVLAVLVGIVIVVTGLQYLTYWVAAPAGMGFQLAWPGLLTSWAYGLMMSFGLFSIGWFAALIMGQTGTMILILLGFTISLAGLDTIYDNMLHGGPFHLNGSQRDWTIILTLLVFAIVLVIWGAYLYNRLSLEHNGEYLLFPGLKLPVYIVFVVYVTGLSLFNQADFNTVLITFVVTVVFGYIWLWRPRIGEAWHQWRQHQ